MIRADSGFAIPAIYTFCERVGIGYTIGLVPNTRLTPRCFSRRAMRLVPNTDGPSPASLDEFAIKR